MTLDQHGSGCRCLLRERENSGQPYVRDESFIAARLAEYPDWEQKPGAADHERLIEIARDFDLAHSGETMSDFEEIVRAHQRDRIVLLRTEGLLSKHSGLTAAENSMALLTAVADDSLVLWIPTTDGHSATMSFPRTAFAGWAPHSALVLKRAD